MPENLMETKDLEYHATWNLFQSSILETEIEMDFSFWTIELCSLNFQVLGFHLVSW